MAGAVGTELMFSDVLKLTGVVDVEGKKTRLSLRDPLQIYMYSKCIAPTNSPILDDPVSQKVIQTFIKNDPPAKKMQTDCEDLLRMLTYGDYQANFIDLFMMYLLPLFDDVAGLIPAQIISECFRDGMDINIPKPKTHFKRDIVCGIHCVNFGHFVPIIVIVSQQVILYLDSMGIKKKMDDKIKDSLFKLSRIVRVNNIRDDMYKSFKIHELNFPPSDFFQNGGNSCMIWSCVIFYVFLKYLHGCISRLEKPIVPIAADGKSYNFQKISGDIYVSQQGLLSFQRGILNLILKTMEFNQFIDLNGVDTGNTSSIKTFMNLTAESQSTKMRDLFSMKFSHTDPVWKYVLVGDCGIPREILGACAELTRDKSKLEEISEKFTTSKMAMLMAAMHYRQEHNILLQLFNAIPDKTNTKTLSDRTALQVNIFRYLGTAV
jgi:hypothetical protein